MGFLNLFERENKFDGLVKETKDSQNALLVDVRTEEEFSQGHVPGALNVPLDAVAFHDFDPSLTLYLYCHSGARSSAACDILKSKGFNAINVGGIISYSGQLER